MDLKKIVDDVYTHRSRLFIFWLGFKAGVIVAVLFFVVCAIITREH